jgi:hypothetical protein
MDIVCRTRSLAILRSCLNAIAFGEVPASVATMIDEKLIQAEEHSLCIEEREYLPLEIAWTDCTILEIVALVDSKMHPLEHPRGCIDRATCGRDRNVREKVVIASAYEKLKLDLEAINLQYKLAVEDLFDSDDSELTIS